MGELGIVVDDLCSALRMVPPAIQRIIGPTIQEMGNEVCSRFRKRGWEIASHSQFVDWAHCSIGDDQDVIILDPVFPLNQRSRIRRMLVSRTLGQDGTYLPSEANVLPHSIPSGHSTSFTIVDDAAYSGMTIERIVSLLHNLNHRVCSIILGVAHVQALGRLGIRTDPIRVLNRTTCSADILHLRDFSQWLPYAGFVSYPPAHTVVDGEVIEFRSSPLCKAHQWRLHLSHDPSLFRVLTEYSHRILADLESSLDRRLCVADVVKNNISFAVSSHPTNRELGQQELLRDMIEALN